ncbi:hypothetical protein, partial [Nocardia cerradoensis]|uniref:hypothetical protein n=1 Tax=Nocardia cerradoensis TaxID=85688 RepID=UPI001CB98966
YRQPIEEQPELSFPRMPEGRALAALIREHRPKMMFSVHNTDVGYPFVGTTRDVPGLADVVAAASRLVTAYLDSGPTIDWSEA